jgi:hypothetical protein
VLAVARDLGLALLDRHELVGEIALAHELAVLVHIHLLREARDLAKLLVRHVCEEG